MGESGAIERGMNVAILSTPFLSKRRAPPGFWRATGKSALIGAHLRPCSIEAHVAAANVISSAKERERT
jgi:hypothetical protein